MGRVATVVLVMLLAPIFATEAEPRPVLRYVECRRHHESKAVRQIYRLRYEYYDNGDVEITFCIGEMVVFDRRERLDPRRIAHVMAELTATGLFDHELRAYYNLAWSSDRRRWTHAPRDTIIAKRGRGVFHMIYASPDDQDGEGDDPVWDAYLASSRLVYQFVEYTDHLVGFPFARPDLGERWPGDRRWGRPWLLP